jgi:hypothetical protein
MHYAHWLQEFTFKPSRPSTCQGAAFGLLPSPLVGLPSCDSWLRLHADRTCAVLSQKRLHGRPETPDAWGGNADRKVQPLNGTSRGPLILTPTYGFLGLQSHNVVRKGLVRGVDQPPAPEMSFCANTKAVVVSSTHCRQGPFHHHLRFIFVVLTASPKGTLQLRRMCSTTE